MKDIDPRPAEKAPADGLSRIDTEAIIEQIWQALAGVVPRSEIRKVLTEVAPAYEAAHVKLYVPIFLRREVIRRLKEGPVYQQGAREPKTKNATSGMTATPNRDDAVEGTSLQAELKLGPARTG